MPPPPPNCAHKLFAPSRDCPFRVTRNVRRVVFATISRLSFTVTAVFTAVFDTRRPLRDIFTFLSPIAPGDNSVRLYKYRETTKFAVRFA